MAYSKNEKKLIAYLLKMGDQQTKMIMHTFKINDKKTSTKRNAK